MKSWVKRHPHTALAVCLVLLPAYIAVATYIAVKVAWADWRYDVSTILLYVDEWGD